MAAPPSTLAFPSDSRVKTRKGVRVLVVDDNEDILSLLALILEGEGYRVETAADGREGLEAVGRGMPDLILLDMKMPVMDGWEFAREYRAKYDRGGAPIVVLTAAADAKKYAGEIGAAAWIGKPFDLDALLDIVQRCTKKA